MHTTPLHGLEAMGVSSIAASSALLALGEVESLPDADIYAAQVHDEEACPTVAIAAHCRSPLAFVRLAYSQGIATAAIHVEYGLVADVLLPLVEALLEDRERVIRLAVLQQLPALGMCLRRKDAERSHKDIHDTLMGITYRALLEDDDEISQAAILVYRQLAALLAPQLAAAAALNVVERLQARGSDDATVQAVRLFAHTAESMPAEVVEREAPMLLERWADHRDFSVREATAVCLSLIAARLSPATWHDCVVPCVQLLYSDPNWRVRKACSLDLPRLARLLQQQEQRIGTGAVSDDDGSASSRDGSIASTAEGDGEGRLESGAGASSSGRLRIPGSGTSSMAWRVLAHHRQRKSIDASPSFEHPVLRLSQPQKEKLLESAGSIEDGALGPSTPCQTPPPAPADPRRRLAAHHSALRDCMEALTSDGSHWVKVSALSSLGAFLVALPAPMASAKLLGRYTAMAASSVVIHDVSVSLACAQSFGDVAASLGQERWHELRDAFSTLRSSRDPAVLQALMAALPRLAAVLGPTTTQQELVPALVALLHNQLPAIQPALVPRLGELLRVLPVTAHALLVRVVPLLAMAQPERCGQWRLRRDLAAQLGSMARAASKEHLEDTLWPAAMALCGDPVAAVRVTAAAEVGQLLVLLEKGQKSRTDVESDNTGVCADAGSFARLDVGSRGSEGSSAASSSSRSNSSDDEAGHDDGREGRAGLSAVSASQGSRHRSAVATAAAAAAAAAAGGGGGGKDGADTWQGQSSSDPDDEFHEDDRAVSNISNGASGHDHAATNGMGSAGDEQGEHGRRFSDGRPPLLLLPPVAAESALEAALPCALSAFADVGAKIVDVGAGSDVLQRSHSDGAASAGAAGAGKGSAVDGPGPDTPYPSAAASAAAAAASASSTLTNGFGSRPPRSPSSLGMPPLAPSKLLRASSDNVTHASPQRPASPAVHPAMVPVGQAALHQQELQQQQKRSASTGDLSALTSAHEVHSVKRRSSTSRLANSSSGQQQPGQLPHERHPGSYVEALVSRFAHSDSYQDRRLFVALALGVAAHAWCALHESQRAKVLAQLQQLSNDAVVSVRFSVTTLMQRLQQHEQQQQQQRRQAEEQQHHQQQQQEFRSGHGPKAAAEDGCAMIDVPHWHPNEQDAPVLQCIELLRGTDAECELLAALSGSSPAKSPHAHI